MLLNPPFNITWFKMKSLLKITHNSMVNKIIEMTPRNLDLPNVRQISNVEKLLVKISTLKQQVVTLSEQRNSHAQQQNCNQRRNKSHSQSKKQYDHKWKFCFNHYMLCMFGTKCRPEKYIQPCNLKSLETNHSSRICS